MPLLQPEIQRALRAAGLKKGPKEGSNEEEDSFDSKLDAAGLDTNSVLSAVCRVMNHADNEGTQLRAAEIVLKARGFLKEQTPPPPSVTIVIQGKDNSPINPILFPRDQAQVLKLAPIVQATEGKSN